MNEGSDYRSGAHAVRQARRGSCASSVPIRCWRMRSTDSIKRSQIDPQKIEDVIDGTVTLAGEQGANPPGSAVLPLRVAGKSAGRFR